MPTDYIAAQLQSFRDTTNEVIKETKEFCHESPYDRTRREVRRQLALSEKYRASILRNVTTFAGLSSEAIVTAAQSMEEIYYKKGDAIIEQDDIGDSFYVCEEGLLSVTRKINSRDLREVPRELTQLKSNSHFGEISLLTAEPRSATITVISDTAKCLRMTKAKFDELLATTNKLLAENRRIIGRDVLDTVPLFKTLTPMNKKKLLDAMMPMTYLPNSYICRQATLGNTFFILTEGNCRVTINSDEKGEVEIAKLRPGDFFGEVALIESSSKRTANVVSIDAVSCLTLSRTEFHRLLKNLKIKILEHQVMRSGSSAGPQQKIENRNSHSLSKKRRISGFDTHGRICENRLSNFLKRFGRFATESLWNSLYSRMYREMLLDTSKAAEYGKIAVQIMKEHDDRFAAVSAIKAEAERILEFDCSRRAQSEHSFVVGLLRQRNLLRNNLCRSWPLHQFVALCKKVKMLRYRSFRKIIEVDTRGTTAFLILRGSVRIFSRVTTSTNSKHTPLYFEEDLFPGELFGEAALGGMHTRLITAQAITDVDLAVIDDQDYMMAQDRDAKHMAIEERSRFLSAIPLFKNWDSYKLLRLAHALIQDEVNKGVVVARHGQSSKDVYFIVNGRVDILDSVEKKHIITTLLKFDYIGETGLVNKFVKSAAHKIMEECDAVAVTNLDVLVLHETHFHLFDGPAVDIIRSGYLNKVSWRRRRMMESRVERAKLRKYKKMFARGAFPSIESAESGARSSQKARNGGEGGASWVGAGGIGGKVDPAKELANLPPSLRKQMQEEYAHSQQEKGIRPGNTNANANANGAGGDVDNVAVMDLGLAGGGGSVGGMGDFQLPTVPSSEGSSGFTNQLQGGAEAGARSQSGKRRNSDPHRQQQQLDDIEDIPDIFSRDIDFLMVPQHQSPKVLERIQEAIKHGRRPKTARVKQISAERLRETGIRGRNSSVQDRLVEQRWLNDDQFRKSHSAPHSFGGRGAGKSGAEQQQQRYGGPLLMPSSKGFRPHTAGMFSVGAPDPFAPPPFGMQAREGGGQDNGGAEPYQIRTNDEQDGYDIVQSARFIEDIDLHDHGNNDNTSFSGGRPQSHHGAYGSFGGSGFGTGGARSAVAMPRIGALSLRGSARIPYSKSYQEAMLVMKNKKFPIQLARGSTAKSLAAMMG